MRFAPWAAVAACLIGSAALAGPESVQFPEGYQESFAHYSTVNRADDRKQVVRIFANDVALASGRDGAPIDSGAVLVMEICKAKLDADQNPVVGSDGFFEQDEMAGDRGDGGARAGVRSIRSRSATAPGNTRSSTRNNMLVERDYQPCFECHKPLHDAEYVFSLDALTDAAGN